MKLFYISLILSFTFCSSEKYKNDLNYQDEITQFIKNEVTIEYTRRKKIDTANIHKNYYLYDDIAICDVEVYTEGRTAFNLMYWNDSIYFNDNIFYNPVSSYNTQKSLDISDKILGMNAIYSANLNLDSTFVKNITLNMLKAHASMNFQNYSYSESFISYKIGTIINVLEENNVNMLTFKDHLNLSQSNKFYVVFYLKQVYIYSLYDAKNYWNGKKISSRFPRIKLFSISLDSNLQIPELNKIMK